MPRANFRCNAWPIARTPIGVLSFESSLPPLAHFLSAENISKWWWKKDPFIHLWIYKEWRSMLLDQGKTSLNNAQTSHIAVKISVARWRRARLPSQKHMCLLRMPGQYCHATPFHVFHLESNSVTFYIRTEFRATCRQCNTAKFKTEQKLWRPNRI